MLDPIGIRFIRYGTNLNRERKRVGRLEETESDEKTYGWIIRIVGFAHGSREMFEENGRCKERFQFRPLMPIGSEEHSKECLLTHVHGIVRFGVEMSIVTVEA